MMHKALPEDKLKISSYIIHQHHSLRIQSTIKWISFKGNSYKIKITMNKIKLAALLLELLQLINRTNGSLETRHTLRIASELSPHLLTKMNKNGKYDNYKGFVKDFCEELVNILGYQYEIIIPQRSQPGSSQNRGNTTGGNWEGVFGLLIRNEADLAFGNTEVTMERAQVVDFSVPVLTSRFSLLYKMGNDSNHFGNVGPSPLWEMFRPFPIPIWCTFIVVAILYFGFIKFHNIRLYGKNPPRVRVNQNLTYCKAISKVFLAIWLLFLLSSYVSNYCAQKVLRATIGLNRKSETLADITSQKEVKIGWLARGPVEQFFRNTVNEVYQKIYMENVGRDWLSSDEEGIAKVLNENGNFAFIMDSLKADSKAQLDCSLYKLPSEFGPIRPIAVATPIGSPLRERINQAVLSLSEQGILEALQNRWLHNTYYNSQSRCSSANTVALQDATANATLEEMSPIFVFSIVGLLLAAIAGVVETLTKRKRKSSPLSKPPRQQQQQAELLPTFNLESV